MKLKRFIVIILVVSMIFSNTLVAFADEEEVFGELLDKVESLLETYNDKFKLGSQIYLIKDELQDSKLRASLKTWIDDSVNSETKEAMKKYGLTSSGISALISAIKQELPLDMSALFGGSSSNVFVRAFNDASGSLKYADYKDDLLDMSQRLYAALPSESKTELARYSVTGSGKDVFVAIAAKVMEHKAGTVKYNKNSGLYYDPDYGFSSGARNDIIDVLTKAAAAVAIVRPSDPPITSDEINSLGYAFFEMNNAVIDSILLTIGEDSGEAQYLHNILWAAKIVDRDEYPKEPDDDDDDPVVTRTAISVEIDVDGADEIVIDYGKDADPDFKFYDFDAIVSGTTNSNVKWSISNDTYATVDSNGVVTAKDDIPVETGDIRFTLTVTTVDGGAKDSVGILLDEVAPLGATEFFEPYITGYSDGSFKPSNIVTRAEVASMFAKILKLNIVTTSSQKFEDVSSDHWAYGSIQAMYRSGVFVGYLDADGKRYFNPEEAISRGEIAQVFTNYWTFLGNSVTDENLTLIPDVPDTHWALPAINSIYNTGIFNGFDDGTFKPEDPTLREQIVSMINILIARPAYQSEASKFNDINPTHKYFGDIEAASQVYSDFVPTGN